MKYTLNDEILDDIRDKNDIADVIGEYIHLKRAGSNYKGLCPFHNEKTPSFIVSRNKQIFHCFGCGEGGDVISFIMKYSNLNFIEAVKFLADRAGIILKEEKEVISKDKELKEKLYKINRDAAFFFYNNLLRNKKAANYLLNRGLSIKIIKKFGLGYALEDWDKLYKYLLSKGHKKEDILATGLIIERKDKTGYFDRFRNRIIFPIINTKNKVIGFGGRVLDNSQPKYLNSPDSLIFNKGNNLYSLNNVKNIKNHNDIILVEGYMDVISLYNSGIKCVVASLGTALTNNQAKLLKRYARNFYICYDSDNAGQNATNKALDILRAEGIDAKVIVLNNSKDPDEYIKKFGVNKFNELLKNSFSYLDYKIFSYKKLYDISTIDGKIEFTKAISTVLKNINNEIEKDAYITKVSNETNISIEAIKSEVYGYRNNFRKEKKNIKIEFRNNKDRILPVKLNLEPGHINAEKELLMLLIKDINLYRLVKDNFKPIDFSTEIYSKVAEIIYSKYENNQNISYEYISRYFNKNQLVKVKELFDNKLLIESKDFEKAINDYISKIKFYKLKNKIKKIQDKISEIESKKNKSNEDRKILEDLSIEFIKLKKEFKLHQ